jgi:Glycine rich protein
MPIDIGPGINIGPGITITSAPSAALYTFTTFTFTNGPATGNIGPNLTQSLSSYDTATNTWLTDTQYFNNTNGIQLWTVPATGNYTIEAYGASGGYATNTRVGRGAYIKGQFSLTQGDKVKILVGQEGSANVTPRAEYGGGGGTFVVKNTVGTPTTSDILVIAGGGGGVGSTATSFANAHGSITTNGNASSTSVLFGSNGNGAGSSNQTVQGGAGFTGNGTNTQVPSNDTPPPQAFIFGGNGGNIKWAGSSESSSIKGGFGGGGSSNRYQAPTAVPAMGGGGGYSGGAGGYGLSSYFGGGGGSYNNGTNQTNTSNVRLGNGSVIITAI